MRFCGVVVDATTGGRLTYPWPRDARVPWQYDLLVKNSDEWIYTFSANKTNGQTFRNLMLSVEANGGIWRVVEAATGEVVRQSPAGHQCLN